MADLEPTPEQRRIAREGSDAERRTLARDPEISDAVRLLFIEAPADIRDLAVTHATADETIVALVGSDPPEWLLRHAASCVNSDETLLSTPIFATSKAASVLAAMAGHLEADEHRVKYLADEHAQVRGEAIRAIRDPAILEAHLPTETAPKLKRDCQARIAQLRANPQLQQSKGHQPGAPARASTPEPHLG